MSELVIDGTNVKHRSKPDRCPLCHHAIGPLETGKFSVIGHAHLSTSIVEVIFQCPRDECLRCFIGRYSHVAKDSGGGFRYQLRELTPQSVLTPEIRPEVAGVSPAFAKIFAQASAAEQHHLDEIAGVGYRKALEFLIKDYCLSQHPDAGEEIRRALLGPCIQKFVTDPNIKECAKRAAWLGNDETHYLRRWEDKDIKDLKTLIELTASWIHSSILTKQYLESMPAT